MKLLQKYKKYILKLFKIDHLDSMIDMAIYEDGLKLVNRGNPWDFWWRVEYLEQEFNLNLTFEEQKQLFFEFIEYYMKKGFLRFNNYYKKTIPESKKDVRPNLPENHPLKYRWDSRNVKWSKSKDEYPNSKELVEYLKSKFPKNENDFELDQYDFFYGDCPPAYWFWKDPENPDDKGKWYPCD